MIFKILTISLLSWLIIIHYKVRFEWRADTEGHFRLYFIYVIKEWNRVDGQYFNITYSQKLF